MTTSTDVYKTQIELLLDFFLTRRETILNRWWTQCAPDERLHTSTCFSREEFTNQLPALLHILAQRIAGDTRTNNLVEKIGEYGLYRQQKGYSLTDLFAELNNFYIILDEEIMEFLSLHPQTQPQVIAQAYGQLLRLSNDVGREGLLYIDRVGQIRTAEQVQTLNNLQRQINQLVDHLQQSVHDLRSHLGIFSTAATLLQQPLKSDDREKYMAMLSRNVTTAEHILGQLLAYAKQEVKQAKPISDTD